MADLCERIRTEWMMYKVKMSEFSEHTTRMSLCFNICLKRREVWGGGDNSWLLDLIWLFPSHVVVFYHSQIFNAGLRLCVLTSMRVCVCTWTRLARCQTFGKVYVVIHSSPLMPGNETESERGHAHTHSHSHTHVHTRSYAHTHTHTHRECCMSLIASII